MRYFSLKEANLVLDSIMPYIQEFIEIREEMSRISEESQETSDELEKMYLETSLLELNKKANLSLQTIAESGCSVKGVNPLLLDFLSKKDGKDIWLCWLEGEDTIQYWHGIHEGFMGRKPIETLEEQEDSRI